MASHETAIKAARSDNSSADVAAVYGANGAIAPDGTSAAVRVAVFSSTVRAGFPSPAEDYIEGMLDLNEHLISHPAATFIVRVAGDSMVGAGIYPNDLLVVDRSIRPIHGRVVIAMLAGGLTLKRLEIKNKRWRLVAANPDYPPIEISPIADGAEPEDCTIWGVVTSTIRKF
ncbi:MAG: translesion error-prone DNA polymerase V autoproteolytic subunit [Rhodospirillaceae bacterium]|nr:translesion error-prone DNA polymerase V autoproteolytic subunit [Rhodospirillaceae bacterium]